MSATNAQLLFLNAHTIGVPVLFHATSHAGFLCRVVQFINGGKEVVATFLETSKV